MHREILTKSCEATNLSHFTIVNKNDGRERLQTNRIQWVCQHQSVNLSFYGSFLKYYNPFLSHLCYKIDLLAAVRQARLPQCLTNTAAQYVVDRSTYFFLFRMIKLEERSFPWEDSVRILSWMSSQTGKLLIILLRPTFSFFHKFPWCFRWG